MKPGQVMSPSVWDEKPPSPAGDVSKVRPYREKIRIALVIDKIVHARAGTEKQILEIISRLDKNRFEPTLIVLENTDWLEKKSFPWETILLGYRGFFKLNFPRVVDRFRALQRRRRFHIVHVFFEESVFLAWLGTAGIRPAPALLASQRDVGMGKGGRPWYHVFYDVIRPFVLKRYDGMVVNCHNVKKFVQARDKIEESRIKVVYNGINPTDEKYPEPPFFRKFRADIWFGMAANFVPAKRHDVFLKALAYLRRDCPDLFFGALLLGQGPNEESLRRMTVRLNLADRVHFAGSVKNVAAYLQRMDVGVISSDGEGLSNAVMECMRCSLPMVVTDVGGNSELVDAENGFLAPAGDSIALADALKVLAHNPILRREMGMKSRSKIERTFSWDRAQEELQNHYESVAAVRAGIVKGGKPNLYKENLK